MKVFFDINLKIFLLFTSIAIGTFLFLSQAGCNTAEPDTGRDKSLTLSLEDVSCTEAWLNLKIESTALPIK